jgi:nitrogen fixation protein FixH
MTRDARKSYSTGKIVLWSFLVFFAIFASVDIFFVYKAVSTHPGVMSENAYEIGLNYNKIIEETKKRTHDSTVTQTSHKPD